MITVAREVEEHHVADCRQVETPRRAVGADEYTWALGGFAGEFAGKFAEDRLATVGGDRAVECADVVSKPTPAAATSGDQMAASRWSSDGYQTLVGGSNHAAIKWSPVGSRERVLDSSARVDRVAEDEDTWGGDLIELGEHRAHLRARSRRDRARDRAEIAREIAPKKSRGKITR